MTARVLIDGSSELVFDYAIPAGLTVLAGCRVRVPLRRQSATGTVLAVGEALQADFAMRELESLIDPEPLITPVLLRAGEWIANYYGSSIESVIRSLLPEAVRTEENSAKTRRLAVLDAEPAEAVMEKLARRAPRQHAILLLLLDAADGRSPVADLGEGAAATLKAMEKAGLLRIETEEVRRNPDADELEEILEFKPLALNPGQAAALEKVLYAVTHPAEAKPVLLLGVTGSGKTEVYLQAAQRALDLGKTVLILVPEISLTPQLVHRFRARFDDGIAILHSGLSDGERYDEWRRIRRGLARIVIGARSAVFAPLENIGVIVVDEEHESSFKQTDGLRYNARDLALVRGRMERALVVLGSATPLVTSLYAVEQGRLGLLSLPERVRGIPMPTVETVAMQGIKSTISPRLRQALEETLASNGQAIIFLNRRGFATFLVCNECSQPLTCPNCTVTLTYHRSRGQSVCHYCDYTVPAPGVCPSCGCLELKELGAGTERVEHELRELLPAARILRMDSDTTSGRGSHARLLNRMADGSADILIGTQMITKGHDFPGVTLVGVINGEASLHMPDFRGSERTFQLLSQVFGRAGRGDIPGRVILQALDPNHYAIQCAIHHDSNDFYRQELEFRGEAGYPPFAHLAALALSGTSEQGVELRADASAALLLQIKRELALRVELLGPAPAPLYRLRGRFRRQILLKSASRADLRHLISAWTNRREPATAVREYIDIDPVDMS